MAEKPTSRLPAASESLLDDWRTRLPRPDQSPRVAVVGIGQELRGDDAAGSAVASALRARVDGQRPVLVIDAGPAPENFVGPLRRFRPDLVLLIDSAQMDESPGAIRWLAPACCWRGLAWEDIGGLGASTHTLPLHVLAEYLTEELGCRVALIGIQPAGTSLGAPLSPPVQAAVDELAQALADLVSRERGEPMSGGGAPDRL